MVDSLVQLGALGAFAMMFFVSFFVARELIQTSEEATAIQDPLQHQRQSTTGTNSGGQTVAVSAHSFIRRSVSKVRRIGVWLGPAIAVGFYIFVAMKFWRSQRPWAGRDYWAICVQLPGAAFLVGVFMNVSIGALLVPATVRPTEKQQRMLQVVGVKSITGYKVAVGGIWLLLVAGVIYWSATR